MSSTIKTIETNNATTSLIKTTSNPPRIPPPVAPKPDASRLTPIRASYLNHTTTNNN
ncbi:unnamed protein product, partial [Rotaria socialis]